MAKYEAFSCRSRNPTEAHAEPHLLQTRLGEEEACREREAGLPKESLQEDEDIPSNFQPRAGKTAQQVWDKALSLFKAYPVT